MRTGISLEGFRVETIVGITDAEQRAPQPVVVDVHMAFDVEAAASGELAKSVDYSVTYGLIRTLLQHGQWLLIESFATALARLVLLPPAPGEGRAQVDEAQVVLHKPAILPGATPVVRLSRDAAWAAQRWTRTLTPGVEADVLVEADVTVAWRVRLTAGAAWEVPAGLALHGIVGDGSVEAAFGPAAWTADRTAARGQVRRVTAGTAGLTVLAVGRGGV